jgi:hypothetical protein
MKNDESYGKYLGTDLIFGAGRVLADNRTPRSLPIRPDDTINFIATEHIVVLLIQERDKLNRAIELLQGEKRRGRPPKNPMVAIAAGNGNKKRTFTAAQRKRQAQRMKAYWAAKKKAPK